MRSPFPPILVFVLLVLLAGCGGIFGTTSQEAPAFAPGITSERVTDPSTLGAANRAILQNASYMYTQNYTQRISAPGYRYGADHDTRVWVAANGSFLYHHRGVVSSNNRFSEHIDSVWANDSIAGMRSVDVQNDSVTFTRYRPPKPFSAAKVTRSGISGAFGDAYVMSRWNKSGSEYVHVRANTSETHRWRMANDTAVNLTTRHTAMATVRADGFVPSLNTSIAGDRPLPVAANKSVNRTSRPIAYIHDRTRIRYDSLGTTHVPHPPWVGRALAATKGLQFGETTSSRPIGA